MCVCVCAQVRNVADAGALLAVVTDNVAGTSHEHNALFAMSGDGAGDAAIPAVFLYWREAQLLRSALRADPDLLLQVGDLDEMRRHDRPDQPDQPQHKPDSFVHLKRVLGDIVTQFELSLAGDEARCGGEGAPAPPAPPPAPPAPADNTNHSEDL